ncbi:MAG: hypothetical protein ACUVXG_00335 [Anaerolineae bacterium]
MVESFSRAQARTRGLPILFEQGEETGLTDVQHLLNLGSPQQSLAVSPEQHSDLVIREPLVQLSHFVPPYREIDLEELCHDRFTFQLETVHFSAANGSLFNFT